MIKENLKKIGDAIYSIPWVQKNQWLFGVIYRAVLILIYFNLFTVLNRRWEDIQVLLANPDGVNFFIKLLGAIGLFLLGLGLFSIRVLWREQYGYLEIVLAAVSGYFAVGKFLTVESGNLDEMGVSIFAMLACVYLVVRGMDNVMEGLEKKPEEEHRERLAQIERDYISKLIDIKIQNAIESRSL